MKGETSLMPGWTEADSATFRDIADVAVPRREEMDRAILSLVPFDEGQPFRIVELGAGEGRLAESLLTRYPAASLVAFDGSASMLEATRSRTARFGERIRVRSFDLATLDWWDVMQGAGLVVTSLCLHHLTDAKKQFLFRAASERLAPGGALLIADLVAPSVDVTRRLAADTWDRSAQAQAHARDAQGQYATFVNSEWNHHRHPDPDDHPSELLHQLVWLKHAGFAKVDCVWLFAGHAVFGAFK